MAFIKYQSKSIYYENHGQGDRVVVLLNGIMMSTASWQAFIPVLKERFQVIVFDFFDQGQSDFYEAAYSQDLQVEVLKELLKQLNLKDKKITLMGISYGGEVAMRFALESPQAIDALILSNTTAYTNKQLKIIGDSWIEVAKTYNGKSFFQVTIPPIYSTGFYEKNYEWLEKRQTYFEETFKPDWYEAFIRLVKSAENHDVRNRLHEIKMPVLVIGAENDMITPIACQREIVDAIDDATFLVIEDCGHASMYEKPKAFVTAITGFLMFSESEYSL